MNNKLLFPLLLVSAAGFAVDWPSKSAVMISNFGGSDAGRPVLGDTFQADGAVGAIEKGEIIFTRNVSVSTSRFHAPLGNMIALDHGDGLLTIYSRIEETHGEPQKMVNAAETIGFAGTSGWSKTKGFYLSIFDKKERRWVNPSLIIPVLPDTRPPSIRSVKLKNSANQIIDIAAVSTIRQGAYTIIVHAEDTRLNAADPPLMPLRIICSVNGVEAGYLAFETFSARDGVLMMFRNGLVPVSEIYSHAPAVEAGEVFFNRGLGTLEIIVQDAGPNSRSAFYRLFIE
ncbi:MAG: peptidoglycan DD-metalloendopeptidase family protein [Spirochaetaceae bacterium]|jgi:hypothetical protein|nr:peptidoglycan DD-metalloendopeptidase family protein [Spirochaetaceae bacterium]